MSVAAIGLIDNLDAGVVCGIALHGFERSILRAIVYADDFDVCKGLRQNAVNRLLKIGLGIVNRHYDRYFWRCIAHITISLNG